MRKEDYNYETDLNTSMQSKDCFSVSIWTRINAQRWDCRSWARHREDRGPKPKGAKSSRRTAGASERVIPVLRVCLHPSHQRFREHAYANHLDIRYLFPTSFFSHTKFKYNFFVRLKRHLSSLIIVTQNVIKIKTN